MKRAIVLLVVVLTANAVLAEDPVYFPDANLKAAVEAALGIPDPTPSDMLGLTYLSANYSGIVDLAGLEYAENITWLSLGQNQISDILPLSGLINLQDLVLWQNQISDITPLSGLTNLNELQIYYNQISDISPLAGLTNLQELELGRNQINDISPLSGLINLQDLLLEDNQISDISPLSGLTNLQELHLWQNQISDISPLSGLTNLDELYLYDNQISDISALSGLTNLLRLGLSDNDISDIQALVDNLGLSAGDCVYLSGNPLSYKAIYTDIVILDARGVTVYFDERTPTTLVMVSGDGQTGEAGSELAEPFVVQVLDENSEPFEGVPVTFSVTAGGGWVDVETTTTDSVGRAESTLTLGLAPGLNTVQVVAAHIASPVTFYAIAEPEPPLPDFTISDVKPVQVVWNSDTDRDGVNDLVAGKAMAVLVYVAMQDGEHLGDSDEVGIELTFQGKTYSESITVGELRTNEPVGFYPDDPTTGDRETIMAEVDPENGVPESAESNNEKSVQVTVRELRGLYLYYVPVDGTESDDPYSHYGPLSDFMYQATVTEAGHFTEAVYPVANGKFKNEPGPADQKYYGYAKQGTKSINGDLIKIWVWAQRESDELADKAIGIVPEDYFKYHLNDPSSGKTGVHSNKVKNAVLVRDGFFTTVAHEIGHTPPYSLKKEEYVQKSSGNVTYTGPPTNGFCVGDRREISNGTCFMGPGVYISVYNSDGSPIWVCDDNYIRFFEESISETTETAAPSVLLFNGIICKEGTIEIGTLYMVENGVVDDIMPGEYSIEILDSVGHILESVPFDVSFELEIEPSGIIETDSAGFAFVLPYPENTLTIKIQHNGQRLIEINPHTKLLHDAIDSVPDYGYINNPKQLRNALHNKIEQIEARIKDIEIQEAVNKLRLDLRDKLEKWLVNGYQPQNPLQLSKDEIIQLVDNILNRFNVIWPGSINTMK